MGKIGKRDIIFALGFGIVIGIVNIFSHRVLEIDFYSQELLELQLKDLKWFLTGSFIGSICYLALYFINSYWDFRKAAIPVSGAKVFWLTFALTMVSWSLQLLANNPCFLMGDTTYIIDYGISMAVQHPLYYVLFLTGGVHLFAGLTDSISWGLLLLTWVQILLCALITSYIVYWVAKKGFHKVVVLSLALYYAFWPMIGHYNMSLVKDTPFGYFLALAAIVFYEMVTSEKWLHKPGNILLLGISFVGTMVVRNNGFYIILVLLLFALIFVDKKSKILVAVGLAGCIWLNHDISYGNLAQEKLGIPIQQVAYTIVKNDNVSLEDREVLEHLFSMERWKESYSPMTVDTIKWSDDFNRYWLDDNESVFVDTWLHMAKGNGKNYVTAWLYQTYGVWNTILTANDKRMSSQSVFGPDPDHVYTLPKTGRQDLAEYIPILPDPVSSMIRKLFGCLNYLGAGHCLWLTVICGLMAVSLKDKGGIAILLPVLGVTGTLLLSAPLSIAFRYSFCYVIILPVILCILNSCFHKKENA